MCEELEQWGGEIVLNDISEIEMSESAWKLFKTHFSLVEVQSREMTDEELEEKFKDAKLIWHGV